MINEFGINKHALCASNQLLFNRKFTPISHRTTSYLLPVSSVCVFDSVCACWSSGSVGVYRGAAAICSRRMILNLQQSVKALGWTTAAVQTDSLLSVPPTCDTTGGATGVCVCELYVYTVLLNIRSNKSSIWLHKSFVLLIQPRGA